MKSRYHNRSNQRARPMQDQTDELPSKTRKKKEMHALQQLGAQLVELSEQKLIELHLPEALLEAVQEARRLKGKHEALRRQLQYVGRVMRDMDAAPLRAALEQWRGQGREHAAQLHAIERWREELLASEPVLARFIDEHPQADSQRLRSLIRNARREQAAALPPKSYRELFRVLREIITNDLLQN